jgi:hypothetical protein
VAVKLANGDVMTEGGIADNPGIPVDWSRMPSFLLNFVRLALKDISDAGPLSNLRLTWEIEPDNGGIVFRVTGTPSCDRKL